MSNVLYKFFGIYQLIDKNRQLLDFFPDVVFPQLKKSQTFAAIIASYIEETPLEKFTGDEFVILAHLAQGKHMGDAKSMKLIEKLFDSLEYLKHPIVFTSIVSLIITISYELPGKGNYVLELCAKHPSARYIEETLIQLINKPNPKLIKKYLQFAIDAFNSPLTKEGFFYINDIHVLLEALIRDIDNTKEPVLRLQYLELIKQIVTFPSYVTFKHKWEDVVMALIDMAANLDLDKETIDSCNEIINIMKTTLPEVAEATKQENESPESKPSPVASAPNPPDIKIEIQPEILDQKQEPQPTIPNNILENLSENIPENLPENLPNNMPVNIPVNNVENPSEKIEQINSEQPQEILSPPKDT